MSCDCDETTSEPIVIGGTYYWLLNAFKDGAIWDITGATITHYFQTPDRDIKSYDMSILVASDGTAYHINPATTFDEAGVWRHSYKVVIGITKLESKAEEFTVYKSLAALDV